MGNKKNTSQKTCVFSCLATSYSHRDKVPTTIGARELNFRVRYGNGCDLSAIITRLYSFKTRIIITYLTLKVNKFFYILSKLDNIASYYMVKSSIY